jgi:Type I phosphodiesterase / nucleotide pyrophosphatase
MTKTRRIHLFVLIDALGWRALEGMDFLADVLPHRQPLRTVLGFSSGAIPTLLTGQPPSETGHWNLFYFDPQGSPFRWLRYFSFLPGFVMDHRVTRKIVKELGRRFLGMGRNFECCVSPRLMPWFDWIEKRNIYQRGGILGASSIFDEFAERGVPYRAYTYHEASDPEIIDQSIRDLSQGDCSFYFLYLSELDMFLHMHCGDAERLKERLKWYDTALRRVLRAASEAAEEVVFTVCSDHGMAPVHTRFDLVGEVSKLGLKMPEDYLVVYDSTMARFWFFNDAAQSKVAEALKGVSRGRILSDEDLRLLGIWFPDRRYGQLIFLLNPGVILSRSDFNGASWAPVGMHGYDPQDVWSDAIFLSNRQPRGRMLTIADVCQFVREVAA